MRRAFDRARLGVLGGAVVGFYGIRYVVVLSRFRAVPLASSSRRGLFGPAVVGLGAVARGLGWLLAGARGAEDEDADQ
ncbi:hypothetical protein [Phytoactinopolyspora endophytica]|uniref:hypothetical protein n=1 Tax=Phytoactinopolyspora endophytica TaxID=1642495 RepID=UPI0013EDB78B|nr:hypothetical protein [Phytoactinopolyspora endophytica]